jgi:hypothetical protein
MNITSMISESKIADDGKQTKSRNEQLYCHTDAI